MIIQFNTVPTFANGDTVIVAAPGSMAIPFGNYNTTIQALVANNNISNITIGQNRTLSIGSIIGSSEITTISIAVSSSYSSILNLTGNLGENDVAPSNDYSSLKNIVIYNSVSTQSNLKGSYLNINAPITLDAIITANSYCRSNLNINDNITLKLNNTIIINNMNMNVNIKEGHSLTLTKDQGLISKTGGEFIFNLSDNSALNVNGNNITFNGPINFNELELL
ncbi:MAG: hypothetical protein RCG15_04435 [Candidatus Rickettsia vulgarisii]